MKIADLVTGDISTMPLVVKSATARETRAKKPYLSLELFDGTDTISGNYWDWASGNIPPVNTIVDVKAQVTEWQGAKQLNIKSITTNTTRCLADFVPSSTLDIAHIYKQAYAMMSDVHNDTLRTIAVGILEELQALWITVPGAVSVHHAYIGGTLAHSYSVACIARDIAKNVPEAVEDLVVVGAMLHDLGKLFTYQTKGIVIDVTDEGRLYEHLFIGAEFIGNFADSHVDTDDDKVAQTVRLLRHIILSHHGKQEYGSPITPQCIEAYIVNCADGIDAAIEQLRQASNKQPNNMWTDKIYTLNNRPHLTPDYVSAVLS